MKDETASDERRELNLESSLSFASYFSSETAMKKTLSLFLSLIICALCAPAQKADEMSPELRSLVETEREFARTSVAKGIHDSFLAFLAEDGILFRPRPVNGKEWIASHPPARGVLSWRPIYADVSRAGDLGYTTGPWEFREKAEDKEAAAYGTFVSIWKKQTDGSWKLAVDLGISNPKPEGADTSFQLPPSLKASKEKSPAKIDVEMERARLLDVDKELAKDAAAQGAVDSFLSYATDEVRLYRMNAFPYKGKEAARVAIAARPGALASQPTAAYVSRSGDVGYTYGTYEFKDASAANKPAERGNYLRIWKRRANDKWRLALEVMNPLPPNAN